MLGNKFSYQFTESDEESELENDESEDDAGEVNCFSVNSENHSDHAFDDQPGPSSFSTSDNSQNSEPCENVVERTVGISYLTYMGQMYEREIFTFRVNCTSTSQEKRTSKGAWDNNHRPSS